MKLLFETFKFHFNKLVSDPSYAFMVKSNGLTISLTESGFGREEMNLVPGSFNPLHEGHRWIHDRSLPHPTAFEISIARYGKEDLTCEETFERVKQFENYANIVITAVPLFVEKCGVLSSHTSNLIFHVGDDTILRLIENIGELGVAGLNASFVVYKRDGFDVKYKYPIRNIYTGYMAKELRGISSTAIRASRAK